MDHVAESDFGPAGTQVLITGRGLKHTTAVQFGGQAAQFTVLTGSKVRAVVPQRRSPAQSPW